MRPLSIIIKEKSRKKNFYIIKYKHIATQKFDRLGSITKSFVKLKKSIKRNVEKVKRK